MIATHDGCLGSKVWTTSDHGTGVFAEGLPAARQEERGRCNCGGGRSFSPGMGVQRIDEMRWKFQPVNKMDVHSIQPQATFD